MQYIISFLEGIITFISPCLLPMLPIYISYFAGGGERNTRKTLTGAFGFGLNFLGILKWNLFQGNHRRVNTDNMGFLSSAVFGIIFCW